MENGMQMTLEGCMPETFQKQIAGASDSHVRTSPLQENSLDFKGTVQVLFFRVMYLIGQLEEENRPTYLFIENVKNLLSVNGGWDFARLLIEMEQGGMMQNGRCSTPKISECHRTEKGVSLSGILEAEAQQKYFLSKEQTEKIVFK